jgi:hypothetical protein
VNQSQNSALSYGLDVVSALNNEFWDWFIKNSMKKKKRSIPTFKSLEEEAAWWDTHSVVDFPDEFKTVELEVDRSLFQTLSIRLDAETLTKLRKRAEKKSLGVTTFIRVWVRERLEEEEKKEQKEREQNQYPAHP